MLGNALTLLHDVETADLVIRRALSVDGGSAWAWSRHGWIDLYKGEAESAIERFKIALDLAPDLPPIEVDRTLVGRAVTNIIENALHAMAAGGTLIVKARPDQGAVLVSIGDTGLGMEEEALHRMFEPYFSTKTTGTGLGLTIAKRNIELNGGTITIASQKGVGTTVAATR